MGSDLFSKALSEQARHWIVAMESNPSLNDLLSCSPSGTLEDMTKQSPVISPLEH